MQNFILADNQDITKAGLYLFIQNNKLAEHIVEVQCKDELIKVYVTRMMLLLSWTIPFSIL